MTRERAGEPRLTKLPSQAPTCGVALVLHGGKARSMRPASRRAGQVP